ncbi:paraquat-inducible protein A [Escherichia coli]|nr:paraquat-inducible protein A [Escherichia coli]AUY86444.1 paraquat-inducible protein A [Escherichia coli]OKW58790.1 paraquat-inducible protein A [Escherichia coli]OKW98790.1 paraquat-inducible protein A [Escherichia coli]OUK84297.1 paraquat-inducible protein A [Escherichia coli]
MIVNIIRLRLHYSVLLIENYFPLYYPCGNNVSRSDNMLNN